eukprot:186684_1
MFLIIALWLISLIHAISASTTSTPSWESFTDLGSLECNQSKTGTAENGVVFSVTIPSGHSNFKISTCHTDHQDDGSLSACKTSDMNDCLSSDPEPDSCGCNNREMVSASIGTGINEAATDAHYTFVYYSNSSGQFQYSFSMECGDTFIPDTCVDYNPGYSTTGSFMTTSTCDSDKYACQDGTTCIVRSWLCDGVDDCTNGEDEIVSECVANGVDPAENACTRAGYDYQCEGCSSCCLYSWSMCDGYPECPQEDDEDSAVCESVPKSNSTKPTSNGKCDSDPAYPPYHCVGFPSVCVYSWNMCDGYAECPQEDDEDRAVCEPFWDTTTTSPPTTECGPIECGQSYAGTTDGAPLFFSFTIPEDEPQFKISACHTENEAEAWFMVCNTDNLYDCLSVDNDWSCDCSYRPVVTATIGNGQLPGPGNEVEPGAEYTFTYQSYSSGNYKFSVECGATFTPGTCVPFSTTAGPGSNTGSNTGVDTTSGWIWTTPWRRRNLLSSSTTTQSACPQDPTARPTKSPFTPPVTSENVIVDDSNASAYLKPNAEVYGTWITIVLYKLFV